MWVSYPAVVNLNPHGYRVDKELDEVLVPTLLHGGPLLIKGTPK